MKLLNCHKSNNISITMRSEVSGIAESSQVEPLLLK